MTEENKPEFDIELELEHELVIAEEIKDGRLKSKSDLPKEIKQKITGLGLTIMQYKAKPTEAKKESIEKKSVDIADMIQSFLEKPLPNDDDNQVQHDPEKEKEKAEAEAKEKAKKEEEDTKKEEESLKGANAEAEKKILGIIEKDGKIFTKVLREIMGFESDEKMPSTFRIGKTTLSKSIVGYYKKI